MASDLVASEAEDGNIIKLGSSIGPNDTLIAEYRRDPSGITHMHGCRAGALNNPFGAWLEFPQGPDQPFSKDDLIALSSENRLKVIAVARSVDGLDLRVSGTWMFWDPLTMLVGVWSGEWIDVNSYTIASYLDLTIFALGK